MEVISSDDSNSPNSEYNLCKKTLLEELNVLYNLNQFGDTWNDFAIIVGDCKINVNKSILAARCSYFKAMFEHDFKEKQQNQVEIHDVSIKNIHYIMKYIYSAAFPEISCQLDELLAASERFQLTELRNLCEVLCIEYITSNNVISFVQLADRHHAEKLKYASIKYIFENFDEISFSEDWKSLKGNDEKLYYEILKQGHSPDEYNFQPNDVTDMKKENVGKLISDFAQLFEKYEHFDFTLNVEKTQIFVHKCILSARSEVFKKKINKATEDQITIEGHTLIVIKAMLMFVYTAKISNLSYIAPELLVAAIEYGLPELGRVCEKKCEIIMNDSNVIDLLCKAHSSQVFNLKMSAKKYIRTNWNRIKITREWENFKIPSNENKKLYTDVMEYILRTSPPEKKRRRN